MSTPANQMAPKWRWMHNTENHILNQQGQPALVASFFVIESVIRFIDMFSGIGGFREGLTRAGGFTCVGHCEIDKYANRSYNALFDTKGEWFIEDARKADPSTMPDFQLLCGGFPCQTFSIAGSRKGFGDPRGTLFFELARLAEARKPPYLLFENVVGLINHDHCRTFATILNTLDRLGYAVEWQCLNSKDFGVPQSRNRVYIVGYLDERCRGKVYRHEFNQMLTAQVTGTSNSIVRERYLTVSVVKRNADEARSYFSRVGTDLVTHLAQLSSVGTELTLTERLHIFRDFFKAGEQAAAEFNIHEHAKRGQHFKDWLCPDSMEFAADHFKLDARYGRVLYLQDYASYIKDSFVSELCDLDRDLMLSIDILPVPTDEAARQLQSTLLGVETNVANWQRRQNANNNFTATIPYDMELQRKETKEMLDDLTTRDQRMMFGLVTLVHLADSKEQLDSDTETLYSTARKHLCQLSTLRWQQKDGLDTVLPYGLRKIQALRTLTTESTAVLIPFRAQEIMQPNGLYYGQNAVSKNMIVADRRLLLNGNSFRLGVSGSGKSMSAKEEIVQIALSTEDDILILDPESEFGYLTKALGGEVIRISATSDTHINALDMDRAYGDERNPIVSKSEFVLSLFEQLIGDGMVTAKEKSILGRCTEQVYLPYIRNGYKGTPPTLQDFYRLLQMQPEPEAQGLALSSELFITGTLNTFARHTNVDTQARIIAYDIRELGEQLMPLGMLVTLDAIYNRVIQNWKKGRRTWIFCDEFYILFRYEYSANFFYKLWKRIRKYNGLVTGLTQNVDELLRSDTARLMLANSEFLVMLNQSATDRAELAKLLNISDNQLGYVTNVPAGCGLIRCAGNIVPFTNSFPKNTKLYGLMTTKPDEVRKE